MNQGKPIDLTDEQRNELERRLRSQTLDARSVRRARIVLLAADGVALDVAPPVFAQIAELAIEYKAGARSLRGIFEEMMVDVMYAVPDHPAIKRVEIRSLFEPPRLSG